jgi:hypothetical protein
MKKVYLFVYLPEVSSSLPKDHKIPALIYVDPPDAEIDVSVDTGEPFTKTEFVIGYGPFTKIVWIDGLKTPGRRILHINAIKKGFDLADISNTIWRKPSGIEKRDIPPYISYPPPGGTVPPNFAASGTVDPLSAPVAAWLVDGNNNTYPGMAIPSQPGAWCTGFQNIPGGNYTLYVRDKTGATTNEQIVVHVGP